MQNYEERLFPARKWVRTKAVGASADAVNSGMFWKLFDYINGKNSKSEKILMTTPVAVLVQPGKCKQSTFAMAFYITSELQEKPPTPNDPDVSIEERPKFRAFVRQVFSSSKLSNNDHGN